jgi:hypothetical protein
LAAAVRLPCVLRYVLSEVARAVEGICDRALARTDVDGGRRIVTVWRNAAQLFRVFDRLVRETP